MSFSFDKLTLDSTGLVITAHLTYSDAGPYGSIAPSSSPTGLTVTVGGAAASIASIVTSGTDHQSYLITLSAAVGPAKAVIVVIAAGNNIQLSGGGSVYCAAGTYPVVNGGQSVKERIERRIAALVAAIPTIGTVRRWDARGPLDGSGNPVSAVAGDAGLYHTTPEDAQEGGQGNENVTEKTMHLAVEVLLRQDTTDIMTSEQLLNVWLSRLETVLLQDPLLVEPDTQQRLAVSVRVSGTMLPLITENQAEFFAGLELEITYQHDRMNPATGPGITAKP